MPVSTPNPQHAAWSKAWVLMRHTLSGQRAMHQHAEAQGYLPRLSGESTTNYAARLARSPWYNATWRSLEGFVGMLFRKEPNVKVSARAEKLLEAVTQDGQPFGTFARLTGQEMESMGWCGVLVDHPPMPAGLVVTQARAEEMGLRPSMALYPPENIINWRHESINNRRVLSLVVLFELHDVERLGDEFTRDSVKRYRVLDLSDGGVEGGPRYYRQRLFDEGSNLVDDPVWPTMNGKFMPQIPFELFGDGVPPLEDLAHMNVSHFQTTSDLEHGAHKTALPQAWVAGLDVAPGPDGKAAPGQELTIGGSDAWVLPQGATAGYLEFSGAGLVALENRAAAKERYMAVLAARMLEQQKAGVESAETAGIHRAGEQSTLQSHADQLGFGFARCLGWFDQWCGGPGVATCAINKDFMPTGLSAQEMTAYMQMWQSGAISYEEFFANMQRGGRITDETDIETERTRIENAPPALPTPPASGAAGAGDGSGDDA